MRLRLAAALLGLLGLGCGDPRLSAPTCSEEAGRGQWVVIPAPPGLFWDDADFPAVDLEGDYVLVGRSGCATCGLQTLSLPAGTWDVVETPALPLDSQPIEAFAGGGYIAADGISEERGAYLWPACQLALLDREALEWTTVECPEYLRTMFLRGWTGKEFVSWGGSVPIGSDYPTVETRYTASWGGAFFEPKTGTWRVLPPAWPDTEHTAETNSVSGHSAVTWTRAGLFVYGLTEEQDTARAALFTVDDEEWVELDLTEGPPPRRYAKLRATDDHVYLYGGSTLGNPPGGAGGWPDSNYSRLFRDLWRLSLDDLTWEEVEVAPFADLQGANSVVLGDELMFLGARCAHPTLYDPESGEWSAGSPADRPPSMGQMIAVSGRAFVNRMSQGGPLGGPVPAVFVFEP
jgi:hypothetical protein